MTVYLADGNVLVALVVADHVHHEVALARRHDGGLVTLDKGLALLHGEPVLHLRP